MDRPIERAEAVPQHHREAAHPTPRSYITIAIVLSTITGIEVGIFYVDLLKEIIVTIFVVLSATKFALVAMFYMHLKFDSRLFSTFFVGGMLLASAMIITLLALFRFFT